VLAFAFPPVLPLPVLGRVVRAGEEAEGVPLQQRSEQLRRLGGVPRRRDRLFRATGIAVRPETADPVAAIASACEAAEVALPVPPELLDDEVVRTDAVGAVAEMAHLFVAGPPVLVEPAGGVRPTPVEEVGRSLVSLELVASFLRFAIVPVREDAAVLRDQESFLFHRAPLVRRLLGRARRRGGEAKEVTSQLQHLLADDRHGALRGRRG